MRGVNDQLPPPRRRLWKRAGGDIKPGVCERGQNGQTAKAVGETGMKHQD